MDNRFLTEPICNSPYEHPREVSRGEGERQARRIVSALVDKGVLVSDNPRAPLRLAFPATLASRWMPGMFPYRK